jgi:hypothetical protein
MLCPIWRACIADRAGPWVSLETIDASSFRSRGIREAVNRDESLQAPQILGMATCTRLRHRGCIRCRWCSCERGAADCMGGRCRDCRAVVRRAGLAMAAVAGAGPRGDTGRRDSSILAAGGWSNCCLRHASAEDWAALKRRTRHGRAPKAAAAIQPTSEIRAVGVLAGDDDEDVRADSAGVLQALASPCSNPRGLQLQSLSADDAAPCRPAQKTGRAPPRESRQ